MKKLVFFVAFMLLAVCGVIGDKQSPAQATSTGFCMQQYNSGADGLSYPCPPVGTANPNGTSGFGAYEFANSIGMNVHMVDTEYQNYSFVLGLLKYLNMHHVRDGASIVSGNQYVINSLNGFAANGIKTNLISDTGETISSLTSIANMLNPGVIESLEGPNELDICCYAYNSSTQQYTYVAETNWAKEDIFNMQQVVHPFAHANGIQSIGPATGFSDYAPLGDLSGYIDYGNTHDYAGGFYPETMGFGGVGFGGYGYGSVLYNVSNAKQSSLSKPVAATEFGYQVVPYTQNQNDELSQGTFTLRQIFYHVKHGISKMYLYALFDSGGQSYGLVNTYAAHERQLLQELGGFMQLTKDTTPYGQSCSVPIKTTTGGVDSFGLCFSDGRTALVMWQPAVTYDPNALTDNRINAIDATVIPNPGFTPSSAIAWYDTAGGPWTSSTATLSSVPVTDRPMLLMLNGPSSPTPVPAPPTYPPTPVPTATPFVAPTPTPMPTATPIAVAIRQFATTQNNSTNTVNITSTFNSSPQYGDYLLSGWSFTQFGASRYIVHGPGILQRIDPGSNEQTNLLVPIDCSPSYDYQGYEEACEDLWGGYISNPGYNNTNLNWAASAGVTNSAVHYDFSGSDASAPVGQIQTALSEFNTTTCPGATVVRAGSVAVCIVAAKNGTGFGPAGTLSTGYTNSGWIFDGEQIPTEAMTYEFHYPATATANQVIPSMTFSNGGASLDYAVAETIVIQPPAH